MIRSSGLPALLGLLVACASSPPPAAETPEPAAAPAAEAPKSEPDPELSPEAAALIAETEGTPPPTTTTTEKSSPLPGSDSSAAGHDLTYRVKSDSLLIQVAGVQFLPKAKAKKLKKGFGVDIELEARADKTVVLGQSDSGPMAVAAIVSGKNEVVGDKKTVGPDRTLDAGTTQFFRRSWPYDDSGIEPGQEGELQVGLWGLGPSVDAKKPVRRFFVIRISVDKKGNAVVNITPPKDMKK